MIEVLLYCLMGVGLGLLIRVFVKRRPPISQEEIRNLADDLFVEEYNKYREEALRRAK